MNVSSIVVGVDFSEPSLVAVRHAMAIAKQVGARLTLVHVGALPEAANEAGEPVSSAVEEFRELVSARLAADRDRLGELRERLDGQGVELSQILVDDFPDAGILSAAREVAAELTVVGSHGRGSVGRFLLGSVAERVVRGSRNAVLVARGERPAEGYRSIAVAVDFSACSRRAVELALSMAAPEASVTLINCWNAPPILGPVSVVSPSSDYRGVIAEASTSTLQGLADELADRGVAVSTRVLEGEAAHMLTEWAREHEPDLVVLGSHGRRGARRWLLGSVAERVVRYASCSVAVVHGPAPE